MQIHDNMDNAITRSIMNVCKKEKPEGKIKRKSDGARARLQLRKEFGRKRADLDAVGVTSFKKWLKVQ